LKYFSISDAPTFSAASLADRRREEERTGVRR
jgi:hypothetical protein